MRRFVLTLFGISIAFPGMCTMAYAKIDSMPMTHVAACEAAGRHGTTSPSVSTDMSAGRCEQGEISLVFRPQMPCADGSCFMQSAVKTSGAVSADILSQITNASLPPQLDAPVMPTFVVRSVIERENPRAPPGLLDEVVLRE